MITFDDAMRWQARASASWLFATRDENSDEFRVRTSIRYRTGEICGREINIGLAVDYNQISGSDMLQEKHESTAMWLELTLNGW